MEIREARVEDLEGVLALYAYLKPGETFAVDERTAAAWAEILRTEKHHVLLGIMDGQAVSSCVVSIVANLTHGQRPYALVENVVTHGGFRNKGYATAVLDAAKALAAGENCYKLMLMSGSKQDSTLNFYRKAGYNSEDKTAFVQWL